MPRKRILVVDDGITMRMFFRDVLEGAGFEVEEAANGVEGIERALVGGFDLLLVDVNMPKMDGYEMVRQLRDDPALRAIPVVTISTEDKDSDVVRAYQAGANLYLVKPVKPADLAGTVRLLTGGAAP
jgi:two-component system chemotaxis response regulator CheY